MRIFYFTPFDTDKNLAKHYNECMSLLNEDDYAVFIDGDTIFTTPSYGKQIEDIIKKYPDVAIFTAMTNRINCRFQNINNGEAERSDNIKLHRSIGENMQIEDYLTIDDVTNKGVMSGFLMVIKKSFWNKTGNLPEGSGMLGVDNEIHKRARAFDEKVYLMKGVYLYHWYSGFTPKGEKRDIKHLL